MERVFNLLKNINTNDRDIQDALDTLPAAFQYAYGESRFAVWHKDWDFVLKIPRYGYATIDFCQREVDNYREAFAYGVERICLPIEHVYTTPSGIRIYKQKRYDFCTSDGLDSKINYRHYLRKRNVPRDEKITAVVIGGCHQGYRINAYWIARMVQLYGKKFAKSFEQWTRDCRINDLHDFNTGWLDNKPILLDYAGFFH